jgi:hypothetical protein
MNLVMVFEKLIETYMHHQKGCKRIILQIPLHLVVSHERTCIGEIEALQSECVFDNERGDHLPHV